MTHSPLSGVSRGRPLAVWTVCCLLAGGIFLAYVFASLVAGRGELVMPLDDVYIHFQYAKQLAAGQPYIYNPGLPPSSGATSFLYPFILAAGYLIGFQGLNLGLWAMAVGAVALACSAWLVYRLAKIGGVPEWVAVALIPIFALNGVVSWHFMSGMETGLVVLFSLWMVYALIQVLDARGRGEPPVRPYMQFVADATLVALIRPEGAILTLLAVGAVAFQIWRKRVGARHAVPLLLPVVAIGVQPLVNLLVTGSAVASGNAAKSVFGIVPFAWGEVIRRIVENFTRMWSEFFTGVSPREGMYLLPGMALIAVVGLVGIVVGRGSKYGAGDGALAVARGSKPLAEPEEKPTKGAGGNSISRLVALLRNGHVLVALVIVGWLVGGTLAVSTLDTAFWHFKRYQMPFMALFFPLMGWTIGFLFQPARTRWLNNRLLIYVTLVAVFFYLVLETLLTALTFSYAYALNVSYVYQQPLQMARWLQANTPEDAVVAVHDTGLLRYEGGRTTIDMVGLTTPGAADYWRNGPGAVAEFLMDKQPDYIAAYGPGHGFGLSMVADTSIYGEPLAEFPVMLDDRYNVALAAAYQGIYKPEWEKIILWRAGLQTSIWNYGTTNLTPVAYLDVADVQTERSANYQWSNSQHEAGFPTEVHEFDYIDCSHPDPANSCRLIDGGRRINGEEAFELQLELQTLKPDFTPTDALMLVTRLQAVSPGSFDVFVNDEYVATRWIPNIPGYWVEVPTRIPHDKQTRLLQVKIVPHLSSGFYAPYYHAVYYAQDTSNITPPETEIATYQSGAIVLALADIHYQPGAEQVGVNFEWYTDGSATGDYVAFVHLYDDVNQPPVAQTDIRPGGGTLPPGNWLPGVLRDTIMVDLKNVPQGKYKVAIGFYDPATFERLAPDSGGDAEGRLFIGEVEI